MAGKASEGEVGANMDQWLSTFSPFETYLIAAPAIMLGAISRRDHPAARPRDKNDAEKLAGN